MNVQLARRIDLLVRFYPTEWRLEQGSELKDHLLAVTSDSKSWPSLRETRGLVAEGLRARARGRRTNARDTFAMSLQYSLAWGVGLMFGALLFAWEPATKVRLRSVGR